ncbi:iron-containing alcohol dehydrogenase family protein [Bacillus infantis]|uniref:iron-containing alcohol dehydrogenase family protein n=1 Tax=Bacillus infantis TaxID=324767 RepID=UPI003CF54C3E
MENIEVRGAPQYYLCAEGSFTQLEKLLLARKIESVLIIHGDKSLKAAQTFLPSFQQVQATFEKYQGEVTLEEIDRIAQLAKEKRVDAIIGIGGGKILDIVKASGHDSNLHVILLPTLASTCAAWTPLSVIYKPSGEFTHYTIYPRSTAVVLIEPRVILQSPIEYFIAGIADTLAKWYEADVIVEQLENVPLVVELAHHAAKLCKDNLIQLGNKAVKDMKRQELSLEFIKVLETNIAAGGMVGGFGDQYGRIAGAHAIHNGLTSIEETHHLLHGHKVAYGILVQLLLENKQKEVQNLLQFYHQLQLPSSLKAMGISYHDQETLTKIAADATLPNESIHLLPGEITINKVVDAMMDLEKLESHSRVG